MNREQKKEHRRHLRERAKQRELLKAQELEEEDDSEEFTVVETGNDEPIGGGGGIKEDEAEEIVPTTFEELEKLDIKELEVEEIQSLEDDTELLVRNILHNSEMNPTEKENATGSVMKEFVKRTLAKLHVSASKLGVVDKRYNSIMVEKDAHDNWRWVGWVSNNFVDWDGDIISEKAHREYVEWFDKNKDVAPAFVSWHTPGTVRKSPVDFAMYENGFLIMSGPLEESEAMGLLKAQEKTDLGMSHGSFILQRNYKDHRVIDKYRMYECSDLPLVNAANPFTDFDTIVKEVGMDKFEYLTQILGDEEKAKAFIDRAGLKQKVLRDAEITEAEKSEEPKVDAPAKVDAPVAPEAELTPGPETGRAPEVKPEDIVAKVMKELDIEGLNAFVAQAKDAMEKVPVLEALIKELSASQDEKLAEMLTPPASKFSWSSEKRASQADENVVSEEEKKKAAPGVPKGYWLSEATQTTPVAVE